MGNEKRELMKRIFCAILISMWNSSNQLPSLFREKLMKRLMVNRSYNLKTLEWKRKIQRAPIIQRNWRLTNGRVDHSKGLLHAIRYRTANNLLRQDKLVGGIPVTSLRRVPCTFPCYWWEIEFAYVVQPRLADTWISVYNIRYASDVLSLSLRTIKD